MTCNVLGRKRESNRAHDKFRCAAGVRLVSCKLDMWRSNASQRIQESFKQGELPDCKRLQRHLSTRTPSPLGLQTAFASWLALTLYGCEHSPVQSTDCGGDW